MTPSRAKTKPDGSRNEPGSRCARSDDRPVRVTGRGTSRSGVRIARALLRRRLRRIGPPDGPNEPADLLAEEERDRDDAGDQRLDDQAARTGVDVGEEVMHR